MTAALPERAAIKRPGPYPGCPRKHFRWFWRVILSDRFCRYFVRYTDIYCACGWGQTSR